MVTEFITARIMRMIQVKKRVKELRKQVREGVPPATVLEEVFDLAEEALEGIPFTDSDKEDAMTRRKANQGKNP